MDIGNRIKEVMRSKGLTQKELGLIVGYSDPAIGKIINKGTEPKFGVIYKILNKYKDIQVEWLVLGSGTMYSSEKKEDNNSLAIEVGNFLKEDIKDILDLLSENSLTLDEIKSQMKSSVNNHL